MTWEGGGMRVMERKREGGKTLRIVSTCVAHGHCVITLSLDDAASDEIYCQIPGVTVHPDNCHFAGMKKEIDVE
jgi:hypothetical protein